MSQTDSTTALLAAAKEFRSRLATVPLETFDRAYNQALAEGDPLTYDLGGAPCTPYARNFVFLEALITRYAGMAGKDAAKAELSARQRRGLLLVMPRR